MTPIRLRVAALVLTSVFALAAGATDAADAPRTIVVQGHGEASTVPDSATVSAGVATVGDTASAAVSDNASAMTKVFDALKQLGIPDKKIQTSNFSVEPQYAQAAPNSQTQPRIIGYRASNQVTVTLDHVDNVGSTIDALVGAGVNQLDGVSFDIRNPKPLLDTARQAAVDDATEHAEILTRAAHVGLGRIISITEGVSEAPEPRYRAVETVVVTAERSPIAAGEEKVSADVTITWEIK